MRLRLCCTTHVPVVSDKLVYLELQKTASTLIGSVLVDFFGAEHRYPKHGRLPPDCRDRFVVGSVRNPWDYYVSLWSFGGGGEGGLHKRLTQRQFRRAARACPASVRCSMSSANRRRTGSRPTQSLRPPRGS